MADDEVHRNDSLRLALESVQADEARHFQNHGMAVMRKLLAGALCAGCGESLGDGEIDQDDEGRTMHQECISKHADPV